MRKTHNLSSHHHPWEIQFIAIPLTLVRTKRVIAMWYSLEHGVKCVACVFPFYVALCVIAVSFFR